MKTTLPFALLLLLMSGCATDSRQSEAVSAAVETFPINDVRLLDGSPFKRAEQTNLQYIYAMNPDRLLAPYLREAGLEPKSPSYGNWENSGLDGHIGGHYLTSLSLAYASTGDGEALQRLHYMLDELEKAQRANGNGYLGGVPESLEMWQEIARGDIDADLFGLNDRWVPWYNLHKIFAGLRDAYVLTGSEQALRMLVSLSDWAVELVSDLSDEQIQAMLRTEHGGMNEVFADVAAITGDDRYLVLARQFSHRQILSPLLQHQDRLNGLHANTQIPKVIGYKRVAELSGNQDWTEAADYFWHTVVNERTVAIGGNSVREHFHPSDDFSDMVSDREGPETCNTYNMLKLSHMLYADAAELEYVDYYERALYNHILSSQHPDHGGLVYFTSMRPAHYRMYSQPEQAMWCCVGSGIENHFKYGEMVYAHRGNDLFVNLFIPSRLTWQEQGLTLVQETGFPDSETTRFMLEQGNGDFALHIRYPSWVPEGALRATVNGTAVDVAAGPGEYVVIDRNWRQGDTVTVTLPMTTKLEQLPDGSEYYAVVHGPIVLASRSEVFENERLNFLSDDSRMGHVAHGALCPPDAMPVMVSEPDEFLQHLQPVDGKPLTFRADGGLAAPNQSQVELIPFFRLHDSRYTVYWPQAETRSAARIEAERERLALEAATIDSVAPGEQQPESDHFFKGEGTEAGVTLGRHGRQATGWFSYELNDPEGEARYLRVTYYSADRGNEFSVRINGHVIADVELEGAREANFYSVDYPIPESVSEAARDGVLTLRFEAKDGSVAGGIFGVHLLRETP
ncbi:beta-L-arabinofuranosidase domain-containing protein [Marinimicrobium sp. ARAG 43.8]|uniref:beta-L-arabinofuranosidase domain-containing protein n=1 Tax=Marinimicrobium sp. ARAG 43.8 TaxID=3418719 RepID=UPI003CF501AC